MNKRACTAYEVASVPTAKNSTARTAQHCKTTRRKTPHRAIHTPYIRGDFLRHGEEAARTTTSDLFMHTPIVWRVHLTRSRAIQIGKISGGDDFPCVLLYIKKRKIGKIRFSFGIENLIKTHLCQLAAGDAGNSTLNAFSAAVSAWRLGGENTWELCIFQDSQKGFKILLRVIIKR